MDFNNINFSELNQRIKLIKIKENNQQKLSAIQKKYDVKMTSTGPKPEHIKAGKYFSHVLGKLCGCDKTINQFEINTKSQFFVNCLKKNKDNLIVAFENEFNKTKSLRFECFDEVENNLFFAVIINTSLTSKQPNEAVNYVKVFNIILLYEYFNNGFDPHKVSNQMLWQIQRYTTMLLNNYFENNKNIKPLDYQIDWMRSKFD